MASDGATKRPDKRVGTIVMGWRIEAMIGWGASAKVYRAKHTERELSAAVKVISKPRSRIADLKRTFTECTILSKLRHGNVVNLYEWTETDKHFYLIMELARDGDLLDLMTKSGEPIGALKLKNWFAQLVDAVAYTHAQGIVHKDLKPDNILLDGDRILLADWGFAHEYSTMQACTVYTGTDGYWCPEIMANRPFIATAADCWSLGVTLYTMACCRLPFNRNAETYYDDVAEAFFEIPGSVSTEVRELIIGLMNPSPVNRWKLDGSLPLLTRLDILRHPYYAAGKVLAPISYASPFSSPRSPEPLSTISILSISEAPLPRSNTPSQIVKRRPSPAAITVTQKLEAKLVTPSSSSTGVHQQVLQSQALNSSQKSIASNVSTPTKCQSPREFELVRDELEPPQSEGTSSRRASMQAEELEGVDFENEDEVAAAQLRKEAEEARQRVILAEKKEREKLRHSMVPERTPTPEGSPANSRKNASQKGSRRMSIMVIDKTVEEKKDPFAASTPSKAAADPKDKRRWSMEVDSAKKEVDPSPRRNSVNEKDKKSNFSPMRSIKTIFGSIFTSSKNKRP